MSRREVIPRPLRPPAKARQGILRIARVGKDAAEEVLEHVKHGRVSLNGGHGGGSDGGFTSMRAEPAGSKGWMRFYASKDDVTEQAREGVQ
jgi:hypothetical protein